MNSVLKNWPCQKAGFFPLNLGFVQENAKKFLGLYQAEQNGLSILVKIAVSNIKEKQILQIQNFVLGFVKINIRQKC